MTTPYGPSPSHPRSRGWGALGPAGILAALLCVAPPATAGSIPDFTLTVPSREHACDDTTTTALDFDPVTLVVEARSWRSYVLTFTDVQRDLPTLVHFVCAGGWYRVSWRVSEPGSIGCWSPVVGMVSRGF